jgi:acyl-CoA thioesterase-2
MLCAFASDWNLCSTAMLPVGIIFPHPRVKRLASLDHAMWFHRPVPMDDWVVHHITPTALGNARGLCTSRWYDSTGALLVTCVQEALIRLDTDPAKAKLPPLAGWT